MTKRIPDMRMKELQNNNLKSTDNAIQWSIIKKVV
jgi:hypothetical protein